MSKFYNNNLSSMILKTQRIIYKHYEKNNEATI